MCTKQHFFIRRRQRASATNSIFLFISLSLFTLVECLIEWVTERETIAALASRVMKVPISSSRWLQRVKKRDFSSLQLICYQPRSIYAFMSTANGSLLFVDFHQHVFLSQRPVRCYCFWDQLKNKINREKERQWNKADRWTRCDKTWFFFALHFLNSSASIDRIEFLTFWRRKKNSRRQKRRKRRNEKCDNLINSSEFVNNRMETFGKWNGNKFLTQNPKKITLGILPAHITIDFYLPSQQHLWVTWTRRWGWNLRKMIRVSSSFDTC